MSLSDMPRNEKCFIAFRGMPQIWYMPEEHESDPAYLKNFALEEAKAAALQIVKDTGDDATYMLIPVECLKLAFVLHNHGIVAHNLESAIEADWPKKED